MNLAKEWMSDYELSVLSIITKTLKANVPEIPMDLAGKYAKKIFEALQDEGYLRTV